MKPLLSVCVPLSLLCMAITGHAEIMIVPSVQEQMAKSDLVFVGHVVDVLGEGAADVQIDRMISSRSLITSRRLEVWPAEGSRTGDLWVDELGIFFTRRDSGGNVRLVSSNASVLPASASAPASSADPMAAIARELGQVLKAPAAEILGRSPVRVETAGLPIIDHQLDRVEHVYRVTTESLMRLPSSAKVPVFEDVVLGNYPLDAQLWAVIGELEAGDYSHLALAIPSAIQPSSDVGPLTHGYLLDAIDGHKPADDRDATLRFIATAMPLLEATDVEVRRIGARVLRRTRDEKSIHPLMQALNDEDLEVRYNAVAGLSEIVNPIDTPTYEQFVAAESRYLSIWKNYRP